MKKVTFSILLAALSTSVFAQSLDRSIRPQPGPAPKITLGKTESFTLPNGLRVFIVENHKLPTIACDIQFDIKPSLQGDMAGYRDMMSELLLTGTKTRSKDKLNEEIDFIGADINVSDDEISAHGLKKYQERIFDLMSDVAINAQIKEDELDKVKKRSLAAMETEKNNPDAMLRNVTAVVNYGTNHPYGEVATDESIKKITLQACQNYYSTYFRPNVAYMVVVGDITKDEAKPLIEKYFGKWQKAEVPVTTYSLPATGNGSVTRVAFAPRSAAVQSVVNVTYPIELKYGIPDVIKAKVANTILGGGSQGRLFLDLREKHAWTYGSYSSIKEDQLENSGNFTAYAKCRNAVSDSSVGAILDEMKRMQTEKVSDADLQNTISYMSGNFAIALEDPARVAQFAINIERYHMPKDYYANYLTNLKAVTPDDVMEVSKKYIRPEAANIIVVGSKSEVADKLTKYSADGKITYYDNYGRVQKAEEKAAAAATGITADDVIKRYVHAIGGEKAIDGIKDIKTVASSQIQGTPLTITEEKKAPGMMKAVIEANMNGQKMALQKMVYNGTKGYQEVQGQKVPMEGEDLAEAKQQADICEQAHSSRYGVKRTLKGTEKANGKDAYVIEAINSKGNKTTEYYDMQTGLLVMKVMTSETPQGPVTQTSNYNDYKEVPGTNGYKMAYTVSESAGGQEYTSNVQTVEVNKNIPDSEFN